MWLNAAAKMVAARHVPLALVAAHTVLLPASKGRVHAQAPARSAAELEAVWGARQSVGGHFAHPNALLTPLLPIMQDGKLLSWGRPTYGGLGRAAVDVASDAALPAPARVDDLDDVHVAAAAGGAFSDARLVKSLHDVFERRRTRWPRARRRGAWRCALMKQKQSFTLRMDGHDGVRHGEVMAPIGAPIDDPRYRMICLPSRYTAAASGGADANMSVLSAFLRCGELPARAHVSAGLSASRPHGGAAVPV